MFFKDKHTLTLLRRPIWVMLLFLFIGCSSVSLKHVSIASQNWAGTWAASPMVNLDSPFLGTLPRFENQTLRQIVHGSLGGKQVRVRISNDYGSNDLVLGAASIALQSEGANIDETSLHPLTFSGLSSIIIPAGAYVISDPVPLSSNDFSNYAISIYLPEYTEPTTLHYSGLQTSYISDVGNYTRISKFPVANSSESVFFLSGVEVLADNNSGVLVTLGDSITDGMGSTTDANQRWPNLLARRLGQAEGRLYIGVLNQGISGNRVLHDTMGQNALARFDRDVLSWENLEYIIVMIGINDIGFSAMADLPFGENIDNSSVSAEELIAVYRQMIKRAHNHGVKIYGATLIPFKGAMYFSSEGESKRQAVNTWIRESGEYDGVIDFDQALRDPQDPERMQPELQSGDWLHPNDAGYAAMAEAVNLTLFK